MSHNGIVYLLHFDRSYRHARHYIGFTQNLKQRLAEHRAGRAVTRDCRGDRGRDRIPARSCLEGDRHDERRLHWQKNARARLCPICVAQRSHGAAAAPAPTVDLVHELPAQRPRRDPPAGDADRHPGAAAPTREADRKRPRSARAARAARTGVEDVAARRDRLDDRPDRATRTRGAPRGAGRRRERAGVSGPSPPKFRTLAGAWGSGNGPATRAGQDPKGKGT